MTTKKAKKMRAAAIVARMSDMELIETTLAAFRLVAAKPGPERIAHFMLLEKYVSSVRHNIEAGQKIGQGGRP